tara:strand:- start:862 stop:1095 length:234 start_codon:yes stop_codon:yes gene_type:complete
MRENDLVVAVKSINKFLSNENREQVWEFIKELIFQNECNGLEYKELKKKEKELESIRTEQEVLNDILIRKSIKEKGL